jgi:hypothetical protein
MFDKILAGFKKKAENQHTSAETVFVEKLKGIVYDEELVKELAPIFAKLSSHEGFDKVFELIEAKESQLEKVMGGEWNKEQSGDEHKEAKDDKSEDDKETLSAEEILAQKYDKDGDK